MQKISIFGSTGSIGTAALEVVSHLKTFRVVGLSANRNKILLGEQAKKYNPKYVLTGKTAIKNIAMIKDADIVLVSVVGAAGLHPLMNAIKYGKKIALANKEALVIAGSIINDLMKKSSAKIIPVDSEHSAIFQCIDGRNRDEVEKIILTASGGPFRRVPLKSLTKVKVEDVLNHPTWKMGKKITVDSATLINKAFEVIEAHYLFGVPYEKIEVVIHPQSIMHSAVEFSDGSVIAQLGPTDMKIPIQYALTYPERKKAPVKKINLVEIEKLDFFKPNFRNFPCFALAIEGAKISGSMPVVVNAANEIAVKRFLEKEICFTGIPRIIEKSMHRHKVLKNPSIKEIIEIDNDTRKYAEGVKC